MIVQPVVEPMELYTALPRTCAEHCAKKRGCRAFDLSNQQEDGRLDCALYGHAKVVPASGVPGNCYVVSEVEGLVPGGLSTRVEPDTEEEEEENVVTGEVEFHTLGRGRCRGQGWTFKRWPVIKGAVQAGDCAVECAKKRGCTAFDVAPMADSGSECALYGHKKVQKIGPKLSIHGNIFCCRWCQPQVFPGTAINLERQMKLSSRKSLTSLRLMMEVRI